MADNATPYTAKDDDSTPIQRHDFFESLRTEPSAADAAFTHASATANTGTYAAPPPGYNPQPVTPAQVRPAAPPLDYDYYGAQQAPPQRMPPPAQPDNYDSGMGDKFPERPRWRDVPTSVVWAVHFVGLLVVFGFGANRLYNTPNTADTVYDSTKGFALAGMTAIALTVATAFGFLWMFLMRKFALGLIWATLVLSAIAPLVASITMFALGQIWGGVSFLIMTAFVIVFIVLWRRRVPFSALLLTTAADIVGKYPATSLVAIASVLFQVLVFIFFVFGLGGALVLESNGAKAFAGIYLLFVFFWFTQTIKGVVHVSVSGAVASWYFIERPDNPTRNSFRRAMTFSFGSIALGSLLTAVIKTLRFIASAGRGRRNFAGAVAACCFACLDRIVCYFNHYAFTHIAMYGTSYWQSAKSAWHLLTRRGVLALVNDSLIGRVVVLGGFIGGVICGLIGSGFMYGVLQTDPGTSAGQVLALGGFVGFIVGLAMSLLILEVISSAVSTVFVCYAEDPRPLQQFKPDLYLRFTQADSATDPTASV